MTTTHRGEIVEKVMRRSGYSLSKLAAELRISRNTLYNRFANAELSYEFISEVGKLIHYDFNIHFPQMQEALGITNQELSQHGEKHLLALWKKESRYGRLLEKYNKLLEIVLSLVDANELHEFRPKIAQVMEKETCNKR